MRGAARLEVVTIGGSRCPSVLLTTLWNSLGFQYDLQVKRVQDAEPCRVRRQDASGYRRESTH